MLEDEYKTSYKISIKRSHKYNKIFKNPAYSWDLLNSERFVGKLEIKYSDNKLTGK